MIVQEGLKELRHTIHRIRESVKYVKGLKEGMIKFKDCVQAAGVESSVGLQLDVSTRWNATYLMLDTALKYEKAFDILRVADDNYHDCSSNGGGREFV